MCRNIKTLFNFDPPATDAEIREAALQFVRKVSGYQIPSHVNERAFYRTVDEVTTATKELVQSLSTTARPRNRELEIARKRALKEKRFGGQNKG